MTHAQAESELMQIYMSLSEEKKKAIDTLIKASQGTMLNCPSCGLEVHSDFSECPRCGEQLQTCGTCRNEDTYHCAECENKSDYEQAQADGKYYNKNTIIEWLKEQDIIKMYSQEQEARKQLDKLPSVAIPNKTGHWKDNKCDVCGASRPPLFDNYCPNCGCPMEIER